MHTGCSFCIRQKLIFFYFMKVSTRSYKLYPSTVLSVWQYSKACGMCSFLLSGKPINQFVFNCCSAADVDVRASAGDFNCI